MSFAKYALMFAVLAQKSVAAMTWTTAGNARRHAVSAQTNARVWPRLDAI